MWGYRMQHHGSAPMWQPSYLPEKDGGLQGRMSAPMAYSYPASYPLGYPGGGGYGGPPAPGLGHSTPAAFSFKKRFERVDWKKIASADVEGISRNLDFNALQENIMNVTFCNIENEVDTRMIDPNFIKLFKLAQLTIEYLLHSQDYLSGIVGSLEDKVKKALEEHEETKKTAEKCKEELTEVKKESHKRKKMLIAQQQIIEAGAGAYNKCPYCSKAFVNPSFLQSHMARRHTEYTGQYNSLIASQTQHAQPPPGQQVQQQSAAPPVVETVVVQPAALDSRSSELERELREIRQRLELTESQLVEERNARNRDSQLKQGEVASQEEMKRWQEDQLQLHQRDMKKMRDMFIKELKEMGEKNESAQRALAEKHAGRSNLGTLEDDVDLEKELLQKQREQTAMLKEQLQEKINNVEEAMEQKFEAQSKQWRTKMKALARQHKEEEDRLRDALERSVAELQRERQDGGHRVAEYEQSVDEMKRLLKESRESEKKRLEAAAAESAAAPTERVQLRERQSRQATAPPAVAARPYYGHVDNEEDESEEEETEAQNTETALSGTGLSDTALTGTNLTSFLGTLSMTNTPSLRLREAMKRNPDAVKAARRELLDVLDQELQKRGISPKATTLDSKVFENKMELLKNERQLKGKKNSMFFAIRQHFINELEQIAKEKYKATRTSSQGLSAPPAGRVPKRPAPPASRQTASAPTSPAATHEPQPVAKQPQRPKTTSQRQSAHAPRTAPVPAPRSGSPTGKMGGTLSSTGQTITSTGTVSSGQWDTDEEDEEDEDETTEGQDQPDGPHPAHRGPVRVPQPRPVSPPKRTRFEGDEDDEGEEEGEDDWSDVSELDEADPRADRPARGATPPGPPRSASTPARAAPRATGSGKVAQLSRSIELQLHGRGKKPVGGVDTVVPGDEVTSEVQRESNSFDDEDEESFSLTSTDVEKPPEPKPGPRRTGTPQRPGTMASTDYSTNTYGTSAWGSSSRAASTAQHPGNMTRDTSTVSKTTASDDWDDSEMFDDLA